MNFAVIKRTIGWLLLFEAIFFLVPVITALCYWEVKELYAFLISMAICLALGGLCMIGKANKMEMFAKEGLVIVALSWIILSLFGALPFYISGSIPSYIDALFETVSGFTTTGSSIMPTGESVAALPKCILMWRSFTHWVGGMGVLVFIMAFLPLSGGKNMHIMRAESPGPSVGKLVPKVRTTAKILYTIYLGLTIAQLILLLAGGMSLFESLATAFGTAGTGGFAVKADGMAGYSSYLQIVVAVFMLIFSINFNSYYFLLRRKWKEILTTEVKVFLTIVVTAVTIITLNVYFSDTLTNFWNALKHSLFSVATVVSTTGFATEDFNLWPGLSKTILVLLMFVGACAGSTGGGMKVSRFLILGKGASNDMRKMLHPKQVKRLTIDGRVVEQEVVQSVYSYLVAYLFLFVASVLVISLEGESLVTTFTSVAATINNIGPGLDAVGPMGTFANFSWWSKLVFIFDMLAGRLEIFPMLLLFAPATWRK